MPGAALADNVLKYRECTGNGSIIAEEAHTWDSGNRIVIMVLAKLASRDGVVLLFSDMC